MVTFTSHKATLPFVAQALLVTTLMATVGAKASFSAPSTLDTTFGGTGKVTTDVGSNDNPSSILIQSDSKLISSGISYSGSSLRVTLCRYNTNGSLDTSFGTSGKSTTGITGSVYGNITCSDIQSDGKIVVAGQYNTSSSGSYLGIVLRFNTNGTLDTTFGTSGQAVVNLFGGDCKINGVKVDGNGKILICGSVKRSGATYTEAFLNRINSNGTADVSNGVFISGATDAGNEEANSLAIQSDGKIVVGGTVVRVAKNTSDFFVRRFTSTAASFDSTFTSALTDFGTNQNDYCKDIAIQSDGKIVAGGNVYVKSRLNSSIFYLTMGCARYNTNGTLDTTFGVGSIAGSGRAVADFGQGSSCYSLAFADSGRIVLAGITQNDFATAVLTSSGSLDTSFDTDGFVQTDFGRTDGGYSVLVQPDGKIVITGPSYTNSGGSDYYATLRYNGFPPSTSASTFNSAPSS